MIFPAINLHLWLGFSKAMLNNYNVGPPVISWFINPMNTIVIGIINHSYWSYLHQLSHLGGPTLYLLNLNQTLVSSIVFHHPNIISEIISYH